MKATPYILLALAALMACSPIPEQPEVVPSAKLANLPTVPWGGSDGFTVDIISTVEVKAEISGAEWLHYYGMELTARSNGSRSLVFDARPNLNEVERHAGVRISDAATGEQLLEFQITQGAGETPFATVTAPDNVPYSGGEVVLPLRTNVPLEVKAGADWVSIVSVDEKQLTLQVQSNPNDEERKAVLRFLFKATGDELASVELTQRAKPTAGILLTSIWSRYAASDAAWYNSFGMEPGTNMDRCIAMDDQYVYTTLIANNNPGDSWGIVVLDRQSGEYVTTLRGNAGIQPTGLWAVSALQVMDSEEGSVLVASNMCRSQDGATLNIYAWKNLESAPQEVNFPYGSIFPDARFGDKMGCRGNWKDGELYFMDYYPSGRENRNLLIFKIENGIIKDRPTAFTFQSTLSGANNMATLVHLDGDQYLYSGTSASSEFYACTLTRTSDSEFGMPEFKLLPSRGFDAVMNGTSFLELGGKRYMLWVTHDRSTEDRSAWVKTLKLSGASFSEGLKALEDVSEAIAYPLAVPAGIGNGNHTGDMALRQIDGQWYAAALGTGSGITVFRIDKE